MNLVKEGKYFYFKDNVFYGEKLFVVYSVVKWVVGKAKEGVFDEEQVKNYLNAISAYLKGDIDIFWENGTLYVSKLR